MLAFLLRVKICSNFLPGLIKYELNQIKRRTYIKRLMDNNGGVKNVKKFNVTGICIPEEHYMVDISNKVRQIERMVDEGQYFTINRPRQFGKTTAMSIIAKALSERYIVIDTSFEGIGDDMFSTEEVFCKTVFDIFARSVRFTDRNLFENLKGYANTTTSFNKLSDNLTDLIESLDKGAVLMIDEVDKSSANRVFMQFLGALRNKYLAMKAKKDISFKSVILGGVHDIKNIKLQIRDERDRVFNSPWNVAADFKVDMSFSADEIETMLLEYVKETGIKMDTGLLANEIRRFTSGYPYLVSRLCKNIDEYLDRDWTVKGIEEAVKMTLKEKSTLFDDVIKNIENNEDIKAVINEILVEGRSITYNPFAYEKGLMYGLFAEKDGKLVIHNKIFEEMIYGYLLEQKNMRDMNMRFTAVDENQFIHNGRLDMERCLLKFQEVMYQEYRQENERFYEAYGRLMFLAYLKPIINGKGFSFVEAQTRGSKRMDVVVTYGNEKFIVELKVWNGEKYEEKGLEQLAGYLDAQGLDDGYMMVFNFNKNKEYTHQWTQFEGKNIFEVIV